MIIVLVLLLIAGVYWLKWLAYVRRMDRMTAKLPSPPSSGIPLLGHGMLFLGSNEKIFQNLLDIAAIASNNKGAVKMWLGPKLCIALVHPEDSQIVLENCLDKHMVYRFMRAWLGHGLFVSPLQLWKSQRKALLPVFHNRNVEEYIGVIDEQANVLTEKLREQDGKGYFDCLPYITACTLDIVFETSLGERMDVQNSPHTPYLRARQTVIEILNMRLFKVWLQPDCLFNLTPYAKQQKENIVLTHNFTNEVVKKKRLEYETRKTNNNITQSDGKLRAVLDLLFGCDIEFTDEQLREHIDSFTIAGNDTTALVIAYTLMLLGIHQDVQETVIKEQKAIFGDSRRGAMKEDVQKMHYLERVIKESMRLYTVVPIIARNTDKDIYLPGCDTTVPAGTGIVVGAFAVNRSEASWGPNAHEFDPDRFLPQRSANRHPAAFLPFSYGTRNCIGRNFGMLIMKSVISNVIRALKFEADEVGPLKVEMLLFPINGHQVKVTAR